MIHTAPARATRRLAPAAALVLALASPAAADVFRVYGEAHGGGAFGSGLTGDQKDEAFTENASPGMYGAKIGARVLVLDASVQHHQFVGSGLSTWTQFLLGLGFEAAVGAPTLDAKGKVVKEAATFMEIGVGAGFGLGTGAQVDPPLSNDEVTDKGLVVEGRLGFGMHLNPLFDLGVAVPVTWGYYVKNGVDSAVNDVSDRYSQVHVEVQLYLRLKLSLL